MSAEPPAGIKKDDEWVVDCVAGARQVVPMVTDIVADTITELLNGTLSERALTPAEVTIFAKRLISGMVPAKPTVTQDPDAPA
jgi:hypothetical protein